MIAKKEKDGQAAWFLEIVDFGNQVEAPELCEALRAKGVECEVIRDEW
ncbi:hypothetical protein LG047_12170 [Methylocystis sp. WRRC1]|nr:hypothetical protein [Methylocystis sp. WRRC1]MCC3246071.1 hypothetical protein [Methylocystis sp. WRRC1]